MLISPIALHAQYYLYNDVPINLEASFSRHSIESYAKQTFFNVLKIKNKSNRSEIFTLNITVPQGWSVIGQDKVELNINPLDSIIVPIRVAVGAVVRGDIGYSIIASLTDSRGNTIQNVYCFVKIPRQTDLSVRILNRIIYLDPISYSAEFSVLVKNKGNREELVNLLFDGNRQLGIGKQNQTLFSSDVSIPPYIDSTFTYHVELKQEEQFGKNMFGLKAKISTVDTSYTSTIWLNLTSSTFKNNISSDEKPLTVEIIAQGLLDSEQKPIISATIEGKTLFHGNSEIYYYYRNYDSKTRGDFYKYNRMYLGTKVGNFQLEIGDSYRSIESTMSGRGGYFAYNGKSVRTELIASKNNRTEMDNIGGSASYYFAPYSYLKTGVAYNKSNLIDFNSKLGFIGTGLTINKNHNFYFNAVFNQIHKDIVGKKVHDALGGEFNYNSRVNNFTTYIKAKYGSSLLYSAYSGKFQFSGNTSWSVDQKNILRFIYDENRDDQVSILNTATGRPETSITNRESKFEYIYSISPSISVYGGPSVANIKWKGLSDFSANEYFSSISYKLTAGAKIRNSSGTSILTPQFEIARTNVAHNPYATVDTSSIFRNRFKYQYFSLSYRSRYWLILAFYTSGPRSAIDQIYYVRNSRPSRKLQFMPTFEKFVYKDVVNVQLGLSYSNDLISKSAYTNITAQIYWYMPKNWTFRIFSTYSLQQRTNTQDLVETYQSFYAEAGIKKEFDIQHPRVKFYNLAFVFFKDFNGNFIQDPNEPGIKNVLVKIEKNETGSKEYIPGDFNSAELLSDNLGRISLEKIPSGGYNIVYNPIGKDAGTFSKALEEISIMLDKSQVLYIPFVEKNKVFGKIVLNRSRLSGLGKVDVSNVRITSTDSKGRTYTTLTDKNGEFVLFAPVTDQYNVNINNIFYENFDLRQNNFKVQFNGYKQFEVNFVLDEKIRRINFSPSAQDAQLANILQVRKTNLKGSVKDESSLLPIRARVNLINTKTNTVVTSMYANSQSGDYNISFMADDNYLLEVLADGYWYNSENLNLNQVTTFLNVTKDVMLKPITIGSKVELNIKFYINKSDLEAESVAELNRLLKLLKDNGNIKIEVQGHSDDLEALSNPQISEERAKKVARFLIENGFSNLQIRGFGNTVPVASNDTEDGRATNRRVEIEVVSK